MGKDAVAEDVDADLIVVAAVVVAEEDVGEAVIDPRTQVASIRALGSPLSKALRLPRPTAKLWPHLQHRNNKITRLRKTIIRRTLPLF